MDVRSKGEGVRGLGRGKGKNKRRMKEYCNVFVKMSSVLLTDRRLCSYSLCVFVLFCFH